MDTQRTSWRRSEKSKFYIMASASISYTDVLEAEIIHAAALDLSHHAKTIPPSVALSPALSIASRTSCHQIMPITAETVTAIAIQSMIIGPRAETTGVDGGRKATTTTMRRGAGVMVDMAEGGDTTTATKAGPR